MERVEIQFYLQTPRVGGVLPKTGISMSQAVPSLITSRCTDGSIILVYTYYGEKRHSI